jgi:molybdopterin molybdotransferase
MKRGGTKLAAARRSLREIVSRVDRTETVPLAAADGRVLASPVAARSSVPHYQRAAMDGYAIRAADTDGASDGSPATIELASEAVAPGEAVRVHTGSELPPGADAVVRLERAERRDGGIDVARDVPEGKDVAPVGEDVNEGQHLYDPGHRLRPSDLGLLKSAGFRDVEAYERPTVALLPTGDEVVEADPDPGEIVETNSLTAGRYVERWGGSPRREGVVPDEESALARAIRGAGDADLVATIGGSSVGERDLLPAVIESIGDMRVHGVSIKPGHPVGIGTVDGTPLLALPGYPVSAIINAVQFLRPALGWLSGTRPEPLPTTRATLAEPIDGDRGVRRFSRVRLHSDGEADAESATPRAVPTTHSGAGVLSSVALADGWVELPEEEGELRAGTDVSVQNWEWHA